jgi:MYXO-CTERM domain-containing protein
MMDPHLQLSMKKMHVSIYVYMYERYARLFEVVADVGAGLNITRDDATHELHIAVASGPTINNFTQTYNELMPGVDFGDVLPSLIDVALGALLNQEISFNFDVAPLLSNALGGAPVFVVFEALQTERVNNRGEFLNLYLSLSSTNPNPLTLTADPTIQAARDVRTWYRDVNGEPQASGFARLTGVLRPLPQDQRYSTQVDFGPWSEWMAPDDEGVLYVMSNKLKLTGQHSIRVRAMKANQPATVSAEERTVTVWTDPAAPRVWLNRMEGRVAVRAEDRVADSQLLRMRFKVDAAEFGEWETVRDVTASELAGDVLTVEVRDPAGNVAQERVLLRDSSAIAAGKNVAGASSSSGCACAVPTGGTTPGLMLLLGVLAIVVRRRQR